MAGNATFKVAVKRMTNVILEALEYNNIKIEDINLFIPHQANQRIISAVAEKLNLPEDKIHMTIQKFGNTSAASIPIGIENARLEGKIKPGDVSVLGVVGAAKDFYYLMIIGLLLSVLLVVVFVVSLLISVALWETL